MYLEESLPGSFHGWLSLGKVLSCKPLDTIDVLNDIVLTFQYAENLENASIVRAVGQATVRVRAQSKFAVSHVWVGVSYKHQQ